jgi:NTE family protein
MKRALVLSGGGAKGAFQVGALSFLEKVGVKFDCVAGVSVGSLNGVMYSQGKLKELTEIWDNLTEDKIYKKRNFISVLWRILVNRKKSLYDGSPLRELIGNVASIKDVKIPFYFGVTSLEDGKYYSLSHEDFQNDSDFQDAIYASSLMPILWEPLELKTHFYKIKQAVDGGVRNVTPLSDIIKEFPDEIYIINCNTASIPKSDNRSIVKVAARTFMEIMLTEVIVTDLSELLMINDLILQASDFGFKLVHPKSGRELKYFKVINIEPTKKIGTPLEFTNDKISQHFAHGYELAEEAYKYLR